MQDRQKMLRGGLDWKKIPAARRHFYVYALLVLGAVVGNNLKVAITGPVETADPNVVAHETARVQGMKESSNSLYQ